MFYVSKFDDLSAIEVTDTVDNSVEIYDLQTLVDINNSGTAIIGIDSGGIWRDYNIDKALSEFYTGELISDESLCNTLLALEFSPVDGFKNFSACSDMASSNVDELKNSDKVVCKANVIKPNLPGVLTSKDFISRRIRQKFSKQDRALFPSIFPYMWTNLKLYDLDDSKSTVLTGISMDNKVSYLDNGYQYGKVMLMPYGYTDLALLSEYLPEFTISYLNASTDSEYDRQNEDVIKFDKPDGDIKQLDIIDYGDLSAFAVGDHIFKIDVFSDTTQRFILSHHIIEETGELVFLVLGNSILHMDDSVLVDLPHNGTAIQLIGLESLLLCSNLEGNTFELVDGDYDYVSSLFMNADFSNNEILYKGLNGTFRIDLREYRGKNCSCADKNKIRRREAACKLLRMDAYGNTGERGTGVSAYPLRVLSSSFTENDDVDLNSPSVLEFTDGVKYLSWNFVFEPHSLTVCFDLSNVIDNIRQLKEIVFPKGFVDVLDYTGILKELFRYITSGEDFEPVKLTFKGDYISDFFKPFIK